MKVYKILVPHNELFRFWVDDGKLWHVKDFDHTHPRYNTRCKKHHKTLLTWDSATNTTHKNTDYNPTICTAAGFYSINYEVNEVKAFVKSCIESINKNLPDSLKPKCEGGKGQYPIFAYRSFGGKLEISFFVHPTHPTDTVWDWVM